MFAKDASSRFTKIVVTFESREDGGLRAYSKDVPGFVLSDKDPDRVIDAVVPALEFILSRMWGLAVEADILSSIEESVDDFESGCKPTSVREYVAHVA